MGNYASILDYVENEYVRVVSRENPRFITHRQLTTFILPDGYHMNFFHLPTLFVLDLDRDGVFSLQDLQMFAAFIAEVSAKEAELLQLEHGATIQAMCLLRTRQINDDEISRSNSDAALRKTDVLLRDPVGEWVVTFLSRMHPESHLQELRHHSGSFNVRTGAARGGSNTHANATHNNISGAHAHAHHVTTTTAASTKHGGAKPTPFANSDHEILGASRDGDDKSKDSNNSGEESFMVMRNDSSTLRVVLNESVMADDQNACFLSARGASSIWSATNNSAEHRFGIESMSTLFDMLSKGTGSLPTGDFDKFFSTLTNEPASLAARAASVAPNVSAAGAVAAAAMAAAAAANSSGDKNKDGKISNNTAAKDHLDLQHVFVVESDLRRFLRAFFESVFDSMAMLGLNGLTVMNTAD